MIKWLQDLLRPHSPGPRIVQVKSVTGPESVARGDEWEEAGLEFEKFIITRFNRNAHRLLEWRGDKYIENYGGPESSRDPDILFMCRNGREKFAIECKYRSHWGQHAKLGRSIEWAREEQHAHYRYYQSRRRIPVYVALGVGGRPGQPAELFIGRIDEIRYRVAKEQHLRQFSIPADVPWGGLEFD